MSKRATYITRLQRLLLTYVQANWRDHKAGCLAQRKTDPRAMALIERVEAYAKAHRGAIFTGTTQGLYLHRDVTRCQRFFVCLALVPAADSSAKASVSYTLEDASLLPMDHPRWSFVKEQYDMLRAAFDRSGGVGGVGFFVALFVDQSTGAEFLDPISFDQAGVDYLTDGWLWRGQIYNDLNRVLDRVPDAGKNELMRQLVLSSFSFTNPHFVDRFWIQWRVLGAKPWRATGEKRDVNVPWLQTYALLRVHRHREVRIVGIYRQPFRVGGPRCLRSCSRTDQVGQRAARHPASTTCTCRAPSRAPVHRRPRRHYTL
ncbi:hypothetical protein EXIGLDRAFT_7449 [Exidia glandulosa HHB12029]|uniref:Uncharacterized protein n=1 Tax=Exidia glandulosa HHB12029 TaxID=1314781 RepID=A0A165QPC7_EXIGL|nr:hypothetical protein EXIGLDRAFT_7449 [Exidia glandulosa HHB12029]